MREHIVFSLVGEDRTGLVDRITESISRAKGNVEGSRMAVLGGEFAMLILVSVEPSQRQALEESTKRAAASLGLLLTSKSTTPRKSHAGFVPLQVKVRGMDNEGIVHQIVHYLAGLGMSVESLDSQVGYAPHSGTPIFSMVARVAAPISVSLVGLRKGLDDVGAQLNVDIEASALQD